MTIEGCRRVDTIYVNVILILTHDVFSPQVILIMMHVVVFSGDGVKLAKPELATAAQVYYLSLIQRCASHLAFADERRMSNTYMAGIGLMQVKLAFLKEIYWTKVVIFSLWKDIQSKRTINYGLCI